MAFDPSTVPVVADPLTEAIELAKERKAREFLRRERPFFAEFGCASLWRGDPGGTLATLAAVRTTLGFDSFEGLPEDWRPNLPKGTFAQKTLPNVPGAILVVGLFADTCPRIVCPVSLVHIDCDLYSSTKTALEWVKRNAVPGCLVVFDEFFGYPGAENHEQKALAESGLAYEPLFRSSAELEKFAIRLVTP
jgi:hypothetical protein